LTVIQIFGGVLRQFTKRKFYTYGY
jgi:hypothetical protein